MTAEQQPPQLPSRGGSARRHAAADVPADVSSLLPVVRRVVGARVQEKDLAEDVVQETLARILAARERIDDNALRPYAIVVARNLVASLWQGRDAGRRHEHRLVDLRAPDLPDDEVLRSQDAGALSIALSRLSAREREALVAHELEGRDTISLADEWGSTRGAVAAELNRARAKLRVEYLVAEAGDPPSKRCRPVLLALSSGERRRQVSLDARHHLLDCDYCEAVSEPLARRQRREATAETRIPIRGDADIVTARQRGRDLAAQLPFSGGELTMIATAISEVSRNIVRFTRRGEVVVSLVERGTERGVRVEARDAGPGIADVERALHEGFSTYGGLGLGLPGSRRLMDEFEITSEVGRGTTVVMTKWWRGGSWTK